ncbi:phosphoprotein phosphatase A [Planoprotostelium fungivorum]|uniref:Phosphoprotein phosphatase A n=1 Tax=Planoprotostelium fungivorum TaxID=1890364 RepID=A0A2P6NKX1_9EUKA|nr:phosphoprotein phosphatase A [Planoprotostelium fungivorum]
MADDSLTPIAILIDQLKNEDTQIRLNAVRRISAIAKALGPERTRRELIHFLTDSVDDEDEVLLALADELGGFVEYVGGPEHAASLLPPLESLAASVEETTVREKAVESLNKIAEVIPAETFKDTFVLLVKRLASGDWFTSKTSAAGLFAVAYRRSGDDQKKELRRPPSHPSSSLFFQLAKDETPMVRRAAATHFGALIKQMDKAQIKDEVLPIFSPGLANDEQDSVRLLVVNICSAIAPSFTYEENVQHVLPVALACAGDKSWRVRYMVADRFCELAKALGPEITKNNLLPAFSKLLKDNEPEVRTAAAFKVQGFASLIPVDLIIKSVLPGVRELVHDPSQHVRAALASNIMGLAPIFQKDKTIEYLIDIFLALLKDEFPDVRLNIIAKLDAISSVGIDLLAQSLLPAIVDLAEDRQWRVRLAIIEYIPLLGSQLGIQFFDEKLSNLCLTWLGDSVFAIREAAALNVKKLAEVFGTEWAKNNIIPKVLSLYTHPNYLYRMTTLFSIGQLAPVVGADVTISVMLPLVLHMVKDPVPNIRFNAAKTLHNLVPLLDGTVVQGQIKPALNQLFEDTDRDVKHYASLALQAC